jgi:LAS superfamily LD-carboxypeptidase LdcB
LRAALLEQRLAARSGPGGRDNRVTGQVGTCTGATVEQYPNGQIPVSALCPLRAAAGHWLRADAAYAFDRMSQAYAGRFGTAICLTDSYRSYAAQVSVYARKPGLAAVPGTSNHGWGTAVDLCGGIQSFSSAQHRWMSENSALYGWFHPGWAQQNGSKPEPWHWEYGG